ncbi:hypothetical protein CEUSTIGMA_g6045.t1 [Chlamydomonas eustigma]|uniref:BACK domain-containing protein n=1 Tax=Chlamydomonas eustigma TaxID=1157962 RepID=A0A250X6D7_9CHLO|nr:hypothetical protein CEUSTIGMA_g6045.t1 [Chlamydomonas eustigma]|eukprot:GAX78606.1 hypothetical protein CEUSTIGMA_g6045.t1 [Chlamydomonas eustigma]
MPPSINLDTSQELPAVQHENSLWSYGWLWRRPLLSDVDLEIIVQKDSQHAFHSSHKISIPVHAILLCQHSRFLRSLIEDFHEQKGDTEGHDYSYGTNFGNLNDDATGLLCNARDPPNARGAKIGSLQFTSIVHLTGRTNKHAPQHTSSEDCKHVKLSMVHPSSVHRQIIPILVAPQQAFSAILLFHAMYDPQCLWKVLEEDETTSDEYSALTADLLNNDGCLPSPILQHTAVDLDLDPHLGSSHEDSLEPPNHNRVPDPSQSSESSADWRRVLSPPASDGLEYWLHAVNETPDRDDEDQDETSYDALITTRDRAGSSSSSRTRRFLSAGLSSSISSHDMAIGLSRRVSLHGGFGDLDEYLRAGAADAARSRRLNLTTTNKQQRLGASLKTEAEKGAPLKQCTPCAAPGIRTSPLQRLLGVIQLADKYQADVVMQEAAAVLLHSRHSWTWQDVCGIMDLPQALLIGSQALLPLLQAAKEEIWAEYEDMEEAWRHEGKQAMFLRLPLFALEWLLKRADLQVASENTVFAALSHWVERGVGNVAIPSQLTTVAGLIRVQHMTLGFLLGVARHRPWFRSALAALQDQDDKDGGGEGGCSSGSGRALEEMLASCLMYSNGMAGAVARCMPRVRSTHSLSPKTALQRRHLSSRPCAATSKAVPIKVQVSAHLIKQALEMYHEQCRRDCRQKPSLQQQQQLPSGLVAEGSLGRSDGGPLGYYRSRSAGEDESSNQQQHGFVAGFDRLSVGAPPEHGGPAGSFLVGARGSVGSSGAAAAASSGNALHATASALRQFMRAVGEEGDDSIAVTQNTAAHAAAENSFHQMSVARDDDGSAGGGSRSSTGWLTHEVQMGVTSNAIEACWPSDSTGGEHYESKRAEDWGPPYVLATSEPVYFSGYHWVLEVFLSDDPEEDCMGACVYAASPDLKPVAEAVDSTPSSEHQVRIKQGQPLSCTSGSVMVTADIQLTVYDHELEQWGLLYRQTLPVRTGFDASSAVRYSEYYPIWSSSTLKELLNPSAWQRKAYAPNNKLLLCAEITRVS